MAFASILERHADEVAALWPLRVRAVHAPNYALDDLAELDERIEAHLDALRLAGDDGASAVSALDPDDGGAIFARATHALVRRDARSFAEALDALGDSPRLAAGILGALEWVDLAEAEWAVRAMLSASCPAPLRRLGLFAHVAHRSDPGLALVDGLAASSVPLRALALEGAGILGRRDLVEDVELDVASPNTRCRRAAVVASALLGASKATSLLWDAAGEHEVESFVLAVSRTDARTANERLDVWRADPARRRDAVVGAGLLGDARRLEAVVEDMRAPELARLAGEAWARITGMPIEGALRRPARASAERSAGPTDDPSDDDVALDPDDGLPWPDADVAAGLVAGVRAETKPAARLVHGHPIDAARCRALVRVASQRDRNRLAVEIAAMSPGTPMLAVRAPGFRQLD